MPFSFPAKSALATGALLLAVAACGRPQPDAEEPVDAPVLEGRAVTVLDTTVASILAASAIAEPVQQATLSTKLMGAVTAVHVREGDRVAKDQPLLEIDARDLVARDSQVRAGIAAASAMHTEALAHAARIRALHADDAATRAQLDAAEAGLTRAEAGLAQARAGAAELDAVRSYAVLRAPFAGVVTTRYVDPGAFAAPGAPLLVVQDASRLRVSATVAPEAARGLRRGARVDATIEGRPATATIEGVVPSTAGNLYTVNATVANASAEFLPGSAATLLLPQGLLRALLVPESAVRREGDLTGVVVRGAAGDELRWVRVGPVRTDGFAEVLSGVAAGEQVIVPAGPAALHPDSAGH